MGERKGEEERKRGEEEKEKKRKRRCDTVWGEREDKRELRREKGWEGGDGDRGRENFSQVRKLYNRHNYLTRNKHKHQGHGVCLSSCLLSNLSGSLSARSSSIHVYISFCFLICLTNQISICPRFDDLCLPVHFFFCFWSNHLIDHPSIIYLLPIIYSSIF